MFVFELEGEVMGGQDQQKSGWVVSVNANKGGVPKIPLPEGDVLKTDGLTQDSQGHDKHRKLGRALSVLSVELLDEFQREGFRVAPGLMAENLTVYGVDLNSLENGTRFVFENGVEIEVDTQRKPCFQLNPMGENLEHAALGRCGVLCSVVNEGGLKSGMRFEVVAGSKEE